jgi:hemerythrin superfamily protein
VRAATAARSDGVSEEGDAGAVMEALFESFPDHTTACRTLSQVAPLLGAVHTVPVFSPNLMTWHFATFFRLTMGVFMSAKPTDAIAMLTAEHREVKAMFEQYDQLGDRAKATKKKLADQICNALTLHAAIEEEIFYPALRAASKDAADLLDEALVEHAGAKDLIAQLQEMDPEDDLYDAKVKVLGEQIDHHVGEEEGEMFPKAKKAGLDLAALGNEMAMRKDELAATM